MGRIIAVCMSEMRGTPKAAVPQGVLAAGRGLEGDAHAGDHHRQVSLLARESIDKMRAKGLDLDHGAFGENIVTEGINLLSLPIGTRLKIGTAEAEVTQHGKECHDHCAIYEKVGDCIMPREGIFVRILKSGEVKAGDEIRAAGDDAGRKV